VTPTPRPLDLSGLRAWQRAAITQYFETYPQDFMAVATPGAGKTTFALKIAKELLDRRVIERIVVVAPTDHLTKQWAQAGAEMGIAIDSSYTSNKAASSKDFKGICVTYAGVASNPGRLRARVDAYRTLVILDEVHHAGDAMSWGDAVQEAFESATRRLSLTGTPFRSDINQIPFVSYQQIENGMKRSVADHSYNYADALRDGVVRPVLFLAYAGRMRWRTRAGEEETAELGSEMLKEVGQRAWRTALNPAGRWIPQVMQAADKRLTEVRRFMPDAGGLVIASDHEHAKAYAEMLHAVCGQKPIVVLSDDPKAGQKIAKFNESMHRWMVAVRMVSEGVDIPRLAVGVFATNTSTPLFFAQAVGRFVRARRPGETATVFLPSVPVLLLHAAEIEKQRDHVLGRKASGEIWSESEALLNAANQERNHLDVDFDDLPVFEALDSEATFDRAVLDGNELDADLVPGSPEEEAILGIPGMLSAQQVAEILREHRSAQVQRLARTPREVTLSDQLSDLRRELQDCVRAYARQSNSTPVAINGEIKRSLGGVPAPMATAEELRERIELVRSWAVSGR
jgi:superfamily II DNA or RNA helicase